MAKSRIAWRNWAYRWNEFSSTETARIAEMPSHLLRLWKSRGLVTSASGTTTYTAYEVAEIMVKYDLSRFGIAPGESAALPSLAAEIVLWFALINHDGTCEVIGTDTQTRTFREEFARTSDLADEIAGISSPPRFLIRQGGSDPEFAHDLNDLGTSARIGFFLDLQYVAADLAEGALRPLCRVDFPTTDGIRPVRRLTGRD